MYNFDLFMRLMDDPKYKANLFADISAVIQFNRDKKVLETLLTRQDLNQTSPGKLIIHYPQSIL
ncbi:MAG: hypothetical protein IPL26_05040 [Leptospiraceae bacterium]|nr:hypothetical protein [Leptospiraceae bacterium]